MSKTWSLRKTVLTIATPFIILFGLQLIPSADEPADDRCDAEILSREFGWTAEEIEACHE